MADSVTSKIVGGAVCVDARGQLFIALNQYRNPADGSMSWYGYGFNGQKIYSTQCSVVSRNLNEYMMLTYGTDYAKDISGEPTEEPKDDVDKSPNS